ncbi:MAG: hypothetical protein CLLPBCKN_001100 [Chroococcidiopsis cubana SAG 39.79]|uniref:hypothetical protein n=1 Tax=Chroococcidiopsis cubana TaxID=171392 RepID=UPI002AC3DEE1|nr:hypothetical protein [Chroococcidiopsis cubana]MDZ4871712.1 hypothetical protein [Chroococcidiopsis cubana SAG 39.79]
MRGEEDKGDKEAEEQGRRELRERSGAEEAEGARQPITNYQFLIPNSQFPFFTNI